MFFLFNRTREIFISFAILYSLQSQSSTNSNDIKDALLAESAAPLRSAFAISIKKAAVADSGSLLENPKKNHMFIPIEFASKKLAKEGVTLLKDETFTAHGKSYLVFEQNEKYDETYYITLFDT